MPTLNKEREGPRGSPGYKSILDLIKMIREHQRIDAVITKTFTEIVKESKGKVSPWEYRINLYAGGFNLDSVGNIQAQPTREDLTAYATYFDDKYRLKARVQVTVVDEIALIAPPALPLGTGKGKVVGIFDDGSPGKLMLGYPIYSNMVSQ